MTNNYIQVFFFLCSYIHNYLGPPPISMHGLPAVALLPQIFASVRISRRGKQKAEIENMSGDVS